MFLPNITCFCILLFQLWDVKWCYLYPSRSFRSACSWSTWSSHGHHISTFWTHEYSWYSRKLRFTSQQPQPWSKFDWWNWCKCHQVPNPCKLTLAEGIREIPYADNVKKQDSSMLVLGSWKCWWGSKTPVTSEKIPDTIYFRNPM